MGLFSDAAVCILSMPPLRRADKLAIPATLWFCKRLRSQLTRCSLSVLQYDPIFGKHIHGRENFKNYVRRYKEVCGLSMCRTPLSVCSRCLAYMQCSDPAAACLCVSRVLMLCCRRARRRGTLIAWQTTTGVARPSPGGRCAVPVASTRHLRHKE